MTWLELINELRKQPMWLLEQDVRVWDETDDNDPQPHDVIDLTCPTNDGCSPSEWTEESGNYMSLCFNRNDKNSYVVDIDAVVRYTFQIEASSLDDATNVANKLINSERFYNEHVKDGWDTSLIDMGNIGIVQVMEDDFGYETIEPSEYIK